VTTLSSPNQRQILVTTLTAAAILAITMGARQSVGLFVSPINSATGLGIVKISLALAIAQFVWGAFQPIAGALADRYGARGVLFGGLLLLALGTACTPWVSSTWGLILTMGLLTAMGSGSCSFSVLLGSVAQRLPAEARGRASGLINAGGSFGQFVFAPLTQALIQALGWMGAMWSTAGLILLALPLVNRLAPNQALSDAASQHAPTEEASAKNEKTLKAALAEAFKNPSYGLLHLGFFTCGFHIAFLVTHLPTEVNLCGLEPSVASWSLALIGLANIVGSLWVGSRINHQRSKMLLAGMYGSRAVLIVLYLMLPKTPVMFYLFALGLGFTWLATVPPTAALVGKLFGVRYLATLFGLTLLSHQVGAFLGAYVGGLVFQADGNYQLMWHLDIALSAMAALINLPIQESHPKTVAAD
jgi:predicted MFS family arabinose efflux permease